jgi:hypothetical protein
LRLVRHVAPGVTSPKAVALKQVVRLEFRKPVPEEQLEARQADAVRALSNYLTQAAARKDEKVKAAMDDYHHRSIPDNNNKK